MLMLDGVLLTSPEERDILNKSISKTYNILA